MPRAALITADGVVANVILVDPDGDYTAPEDLDLVELDDDVTVGPGWRHDAGTFTAPPVEDLEVRPATVDLGDGPVVARYRNTHPDAPAAVTFSVNGATATVDLDETGLAVLDVTPSAAGRVTITVVDRPVPARTVTAEEA